MKAFLRGFAAVTGLDDAEEQWAAYSRQMSESDIKQIESGGKRSGERMGQRFLMDFPRNDEDGK